MGSSKDVVGAAAGALSAENVGMTRFSDSGTCASMSASSEGSALPNMKFGVELVGTPASEPAERPVSPPGASSPLDGYRLLVNDGEPNVAGASAGSAAEKPIGARSAAGEPAAPKLNEPGCESDAGPANGSDRNAGFESDAGSGLSDPASGSSDPESPRSDAGSVSGPKVGSGLGTERAQRRQRSRPAVGCDLRRSTEPVGQ